VPAPGTCSSAASAALGEGAQAPTLRGACPRRFLPPLPLPTMSTSTSLGERVPAAHAAGIPRSFVLVAPAAGSSAPAYAPPAPALAAAPRALGLGAWAGRTARRPRSPSTGRNGTSESLWHVAEE
jgi:hypothetical protein